MLLLADKSNVEDDQCFICPNVRKREGYVALGFRNLERVEGDCCNLFSEIKEQEKRIYLVYIRVILSKIRGKGSRILFQRKNQGQEPLFNLLKSEQQNARKKYFVVLLRGIQTDSMAWKEKNRACSSSH